MNDVVKYGLIGAAVWYFWPALTGSSTAVPVTTTGSTPPVQPPPPPLQTQTGTQPPPQTVPQAATVIPPPPMGSSQSILYNMISALGNQGPALILTAAQVPASQLYNISQWNYYLPIIYPGAPQPDLTGYLPNVTLTSTYTVTDYWNALAAYASGAAKTYNAGVSGLVGSRMIGMGDSAQTVAPAHTSGVIGEDQPRFDMSRMGW